jgi:hypothetical protein
MPREGIPSPEKREEEYLRFSFLDAEERARLSMPSFLARFRKAPSNPYKSSNIEQAANATTKECN